ncbi:RNase adapter RapZ [Albirhodobacter sp. R86504]|uniref:RNase adapter RapZ n=1 Tax=Albirhodobacter sp. R86504 TaxID=3093848 RepID=UPI003670FD80
MTEVEHPHAKDSAQDDAQADPSQSQRVVLVTGPSGAGRSTTISTLEDLGYETIDNLPLSLVPRLLSSPLGQPLALGIDVRNREFSAAGLIEMIDRLTREPAITLEVLYLDCAADVLVRRYSETRRRHPLSIDSPLVGIAQELDMLAPIRQRADVLIDTSAMTVHDCRAEVTRWFSRMHVPQMSVSLHSFSYKRGTPRGIDIMFDCRFLSNPHWNADLRPMDGRDAAVQAYIARDERFTGFVDHVHGLLQFVLPAHLEEGKSHLSIGFGCTGGQHRSVALTEIMSNLLAEGGWHVSKRHRELERRGLVSHGNVTGKDA